MRRSDSTDRSTATIEQRLDWASARLAPCLEQQFEEGAPDPAAIGVLAEAGFLGLTIPPRYGGLGRDYRALGAVCADLGALDLNYQITVTVHLALTAMTILQWGTEPQRRRWLPALACGDEVATFALTEPGAGSDVAAVSAQATRCAGGFRLQGEKSWISGVNDSSLLLVFATTDAVLRHHGITAFLVPRASPGVTTPTLHGKLGIRAGDTGSVVLEDVFVAETDVLGNVGEGFPIALSALATGLFTVGYGALGITRACLSLTTTMLRDLQETSRRSIGQLWQAEVAAMAAREATASALLDRSAELKNRGAASQQATSLAKWTAASGAVASAETALRIAQATNSPFVPACARHLRNAKGAVIYGGTNEIHQVMQAAYATGDRVERPFRRLSLTAAQLAGVQPLDDETS